MSIAEHIVDSRLGGHTRGTPSPIELMVLGATRFARSRTRPSALRGSLRQWSDGVAKVCADRAVFAEYWRQQNEHALAATGPLWVVLGDSSAQGIGAAHPADGYVGQSLAHLVRETGQPWRVVNLSASGATIPDVLTEQLPRLAALPETPDLVTCGVGTNDLLRVPPNRMPALVGDLVQAVPDSTVLLDMPIPKNRCRVGRLAAQYVARMDRKLHAAAAARRLPVAYISQHFIPPWAGKFGPDDFHPNADGYQAWTRAVLQAIPVLR
jgi:acyl-CoA thioesterase-1